MKKVIADAARCVRRRFFRAQAVWLLPVLVRLLLTTAALVLSYIFYGGFSPLFTSAALCSADFFLAAPLRVFQKGIFLREYGGLRVTALFTAFSGFGVYFKTLLYLLLKNAIQLLPFGSTALLVLWSGTALSAAQPGWLQLLWAAGIVSCGALFLLMRFLLTMSDYLFVAGCGLRSLFVSFAQMSRHAAAFLLLGLRFIPRLLCCAAVLPAFYFVPEFLAARALLANGIIYSAAGRAPMRQDNGTAGVPALSH